MVVGRDRDETGLVCTITVKEHSSSQRKQHFKDIQVHDGVQIPKQLILDMKIRWGSMYAMLNRAEKLKKHVDVFIYELGVKLKDDHGKRAKIDALSTTAAEWARVHDLCSLLGHANKVQHAFSSTKIPSLCHALPTIKVLHSAWSKQINYAPFHDVLDPATEKLEEYYRDKTTDSNAYIMAMCLSSLSLFFKLLSEYNLKYWSKELQKEVTNVAQKLFQECFEELNKESTSEIQSPKKKKKLDHLLRELDTDSDNSDYVSDNESDDQDPTKPWLPEFHRFLKIEHVLAKGMTVVQWWGVHILVLFTDH
ncbi:hypothetical protein K443DRAFT_113182 [Laccaria amethystina LaAM-08-1]|uniref:Uncharacterized protein n=1 Tax=Laccaria amethystina LaAM-08-1 TaxID=1095629 RepID=A0A0C9WVF9_9AGAR|nr:hypothetical protein K443DRAFT_113182 [Laccaria amethystina LaAM-08-1]